MRSVDGQIFFVAQILHFVFLFINKNEVEDFGGANRNSIETDTNSHINGGGLFLVSRWRSDWGTTHIGRHASTT